MEAHIHKYIYIYIYTHIYIKGTFHAKMSLIKDRNDMDLRETEDITKRWQEYTELYKKDLHDPDNHDGDLYGDLYGDHSYRARHPGM